MGESGDGATREGMGRARQALRRVEPGRDNGWQAELLSYEAPTYYGMLCAAFSPR